MKIAEVISGFTIHLIIPFICFLSFLKLRKQMIKDNIPNAPTIELFIIYSTYGGLLLVILTILFWYWSGMASIGIFYLIFIAPIIMGIITYRYKKSKTISKYHNWTYNLGILYFLIAPLVFIMLIILDIY